MKATFRIALAAAALLGASAASAAGNPLDPGFYQGHPAVQATPGTSTDEKPYVDSRNPLHPTFGLSEARFEGTAKTTGEAYRDTNNPLYPGFVRQ